MTVINRPRFDKAALDRLLPDAGSAGEIELIELTDCPRKIVSFMSREHGAVTLWRRPERIPFLDEPKIGRYTIGARWCPDGMGVAFVLDTKYGDQMALLRQKCTPAEFAERLTLLARFYNWAYLVPEINCTDFRDAFLRTRYPLDRVYSQKRNVHGVGSAMPEHMGFETTDATRPRLLTALDESIRGIANPITIKSPIVIEECRAFVVTPDGKLGPEEGYHDGCVWAAALAVYGLQFAPKPEPYVKTMKGGFVDPRGAPRRKKDPNYDD